MIITLDEEETCPECRDGLPAHYGEVVAAQVVTTDRIRDFLLSVNGIKIESQLMNRGSRKPLRVCTVPNDYATLHIKTTQKQYI